MSEVRADVQAALERVLADAAPAGLVSAYLFGSHAAGRAHRDSDVDVGVLLDWAAFPTARERFEARVRLTSDLIAGLGRSRVDVAVLNDAPPGLGRRIVTEGRRVYCADPGADQAYVRDVQLRAADLEPFLRHMRRIKLGALAR
jgi:predicted nucleotidyltransferase